MAEREPLALSSAAPAFPKRGRGRCLFPPVVALLIMTVPVCAASQNQDDPGNILLQARESVMKTIRQLPRYVCTQTVDRKRYEPADPEYGTNGIKRPRSCDNTIAAARRDVWKRRLASADRLRLDVAVSQGSPNLESEMYSWAGEDRFSRSDLFDFVREGAVSTGSFASMLASIFANPAARFSYAGDSLQDGRMVSEFGFHISRERSEYRYIFGEDPSEQVAVAYGGSLLIDSSNSDLVRVRVLSEQLPPDTGACELTQDLRYARVHIRDSDFLLPAEDETTIIHIDGTEAENRIQYSACREFRGQSTVSFDDGEQPAEAPKRANPGLPPISLPPGLAFKIVITDRIDVATAAAGDPIHGRLKTAISDRSGKVLVPEGAVVTGRIMRIQRSYHNARSWDPERERTTHFQLEPPLVIAVRLDSLDTGKGPQPFQASFDSGARRFVKQTGPLSVRAGIGSLEELHSAERQPALGTFEFWDNDPDHAVKSGLESNWVTARP